MNALKIKDKNLTLPVEYNEETLWVEDALGMHICQPSFGASIELGNIISDSINLQFMDKWQSIEKAPKDGTPLMLFSPNPDGSFGNVEGGLVWVSGGWSEAWGRWRNDYQKEEPTHFQLLLQPPIEK